MDSLLLIPLSKEMVSDRLWDERFSPLLHSWNFQTSSQDFGRLFLLINEWSYRNLGAAILRTSISKDSVKQSRECREIFKDSKKIQLSRLSNLVGNQYHRDTPN